MCDKYGCMLVCQSRKEKTPDNVAEKHVLQLLALSFLTNVLPKQQVCIQNQQVYIPTQVKLIFCSLLS